MGMGRRLAAGRPIRVGDVQTAAVDPGRLLRVTGRVRCPDPIVTPDGERLVIRHHTVEVMLRGIGWLPIERIRESRAFQLWDHAGQLTIDGALCAEPLLTIPAIWRGRPDELPDEYRGAIAALEARHGRAAEAARVESRSLSVVDSVIVLARAARAPGGAVTLTPPPDGYVVSSLPLDAAMRLLGGERRGRLLAGAGLVALGSALVVSGLGLATVSWLTA